MLERSWRVPRPSPRPGFRIWVSAKVQGDVHDHASSPLSMLQLLFPAVIRTTSTWPNTAPSELKKPRTTMAASPRCTNGRRHQYLLAVDHGQQVDRPGQEDKPRGRGLVDQVRATAITKSEQLGEPRLRDRLMAEQRTGQAPETGSRPCIRRPPPGPDDRHEHDVDRWMIVDVTVATPRGDVKRQKSRRLALASRLPSLALTCRADRAARAGAPLSAEAAGVASARSAASSGGTSGNGRRGATRGRATDPAQPEPGEHGGGR